VNGKVISHLHLALTNGCRDTWSSHGHAFLLKKKKKGCWSIRKSSERTTKIIWEQKWSI